MQSGGYSYFESETTLAKPWSWLQPAFNYKKAVMDHQGCGDYINTNDTSALSLC